MNKILQKVLSFVLAMLICITSLPLFAVADEVSQPREWFVSVQDGDDAKGTGTIEKPFKTLQKGADMLQPGDTLYIRGGVYDEVFAINAKGTAEAPITIKPYNDEEVTVRATTKLTDWKKYNGNIWVTDMTFDKAAGGWTEDGLYKGEEPLLLGRHPNLPEGGTKMWPAQFVMDDAKRHSTDLVEYGTIWDAEVPEEAGYWDGAKVHMQSGLNWINIIATIESSEPGILHLTGHSQKTSSYYNEKPGDEYFIKDHIHCVDTDGEFYMDHTAKKIYLYSDEDPNKFEIGARSSNYAFDLSDAAYVNISGFNVRGAPPKYSTRTHHVNLDWMSVGSIETEYKILGQYNTIKNSHIYDSAFAIMAIGESDYCAIFNCLIEETGWNGNSSGVNIANTAMHAYFGYNTVRGSGRTTLAASGIASVYEYNNFYDVGSLTHDTGITYAAHQPSGTSEFRYNWLHDITAASTAFGLYFDNAHGDVAIHHNVVWDTDNTTGELKMDGWGAILLNDPCEGHSVYNNTFIGDAHMSTTIALFNDTRYMNNIFTGEIQTVVKHKMQENNMVGWLDPSFVDARNFDFRLKEDSLAIDKGTVIEGVTDGYVGDAPDLGAYEYGGEYWIPGHNWENPPVFEHKTPNYIQWHNLIDQPSFEDDQKFSAAESHKARMWNRYGWGIMDETEGGVTQEFMHSLSVLQGVRRGGNTGVKLGDDLPTVYPGDVAANKATDIIQTYNALKEGWVNYPDWKTKALYEDVPGAIYDLIVNSSNMTPYGDCEDSTAKFVSVESAKSAYTEEEAFSGKQSVKISDMKYSWSGMRVTLPATGDRRLRVHWNIKGEKGTTFQYAFVDHHPTDWNRTNDRALARGVFSIPNTEWQTFSMDVNTNGPTKGIGTEMIYSDYQDGHYYIDNLVILDITELYLMKDICKSNKEALAVIDAAIANKYITAEEFANAMKTATEIMLASDDKAIFEIMPILTILRNAKVSPGSGITYTVDTVKPGRTYKLRCHAWVTNPDDKVQYFVKDGDKVIAEWQTNKQTWTDEFVTFVAPESGKVTIEIWKPQGIGSAHVDDVTVREYDPIQYKLRSGSKFIENNDMEGDRLWPWYSYDGKIEYAETDKGTSLKVTNGRAMQDVRPLTTGKKYTISADVKLAMPGVASREVEVKIQAIEGTSNGTYVTIPIGKATINNNGWAHIEGPFEVPEGKRYDSIGFTAGLVGEEGSFYLDNADIDEAVMPSVPGKGDHLTFEQMMADTKNWVSSTGEQGMSITSTYVSTTNGNIGYRGFDQRDFRITFDMMIEGFNQGSYPSVTIRNNSTLPGFTDGYTIIFKQGNIELQKYGKGISQNWLFVGTPDAPTGIYGPAVFTDAFKMNEWNTITFGSVNEEKGVRIYFEVNGEVIYDFLDIVSVVSNAGYLSFCRNGVDRIQVRTTQK